MSPSDDQNGVVSMQHTMWLEDRRNTHVMRPSLEQDFDTPRGQQLCRPPPNVPPPKKRAYGGHRAIPGLAMVTPALRMPGFAAAVAAVDAGLTLERGVGPIRSHCLPETSPHPPGAFTEAPKGRPYQGQVVTTAPSVCHAPRDLIPCETWGQPPRLPEAEAVNLIPST